MEKIAKGHILSQSTDFVAGNIETLKALFPTIVKEGKIDIKELQALLGDDIETEDEYYRFTWAGKSMARREANKPSTATLRPDKESSKDWDTTRNIFIEGDNLEVLKLLQKSYANKIKMIYIDPPYNTGKDFVYKDSYNDNLGNYLALTGQVDDEGKRINTNSESDGRYHSNWLNMMYPRLKLARNLLKDDGVIFMSIGDHELSNLILLGNDVFGELNNLGLVTRIQKRGGNKGNYFNPVNDYIIVFAKNIETLPFFTTDVDENIYNKTETNGKRIGEKYAEVILYMPNLDYRPNQRFWVQAPDGSKIIPPEGKSFRWSKERFDKEFQAGNVVIKPVQESKLIDEYGNPAKWIVYQKRYLKDTLEKESARPNNLFEEFQNMRGSKDVNELGIPFDYPKPVSLVEHIIKLSKTKGQDIVLDFFAGSGTTAHAVMQLNSEDGGNRKFINVQIPEPTDEKSEAFKAGYKTISELTRERIRRAGEKIKSEMKEDLFSEQGKPFDFGFRAFKLDSSNIRAWDGNPDALEDNLFNAGSNIKENRTEDDVLYEILLKYGLDLTMPIEQKAIAGRQVFNIGLGALFICLGDHITTSVAEGIGKWKEELQPATSKVIFKDTGLTDVEKTNSMQILKRYGILEVNTI